MWTAAPALSQGLLRCAVSLFKPSLQQGPCAALSAAVTAGGALGRAQQSPFVNLQTPLSSSNSSHGSLSCGSRGISSSLPAAFASPRDSIEAMERRLDALQGHVDRLEAVEAARSALNKLMTWLDATGHDPQMVTAAAVADMFTPSVVMNLGKYGTAESLEEAVPLLQKLAQQGNTRRQYITNIVAEPSREDLSIVRASAYSLVVEPVAGARPVVTSLYTLRAKLEKGLDDRWLIKDVAFVETLGST